MTKSELITKYQQDIKEAMIDRYQSVINCDGRIQYQIYIWDDGSIECLEDVQGGNTYLVPKSAETRNLYHVYTISVPCFDPWDYTDHSAPDDESEREAERKEIYEYLIDEYKNNVSDILDTIIEEAEQNEKYGF